MELVLPSEKYKESYIEAAKEFLAEGSGFGEVANNELLSGDFDSFISSAEKKREERKRNKGWVPETMYWLIDNDEYIGHVNIRHELSEYLKTSGGHIGYKIRPSKRKMGYGSKILELALPKAKELGIDPALLTCNIENEASRKIIEKNGGEFQKEALGHKGKTVVHYHIKLK